jgi:hypothetical protein
MSILYASTSTATPFNTENLYANLIALSDDTDPPGGSSNPYPLYYISTDAQACVTMTLVYFSWSGVTDAQANVQVTGPGAIATSCNALNSIPTVTLTQTGGDNPSVAGQSVTFRATLSGGTSPTGTVDFQDNGAEIGCAAQAISGGIATCTTSSLATGSHPITAVYSGDSNNAAAGSNTITLSVVSQPVPDLAGSGKVILTILMALAGLVVLRSASRRRRFG